MNKTQKEILSLLIENEIKKDLDLIKDLKNKNEIHFWKIYIKELKEILKIL